MTQKPPLVLLAAGENSRFFPLNTTTHKGSRMVGGKALLVWALEDVIKHGFTRVILVVSEKDFNGVGISAELKNYDLPLEIEFVLQSEAKGQADAILLATQNNSEDVIVASPYYLNLGELANKLATASDSSEAECIFLGSTTDQPQHYGILSVDGSKVTGVTEKPEAPESDKKINSVYFLKKSFLEFLSNQPENHYSLETAFNDYAKEHLIEWQEIDELPSLKFAWHLLDFTKVILKNQNSHISSSATIADTAILDERKGPIVIDELAVIQDFVKIVGPTYIGKNVLIGDYSFIRNSSIEKDAVVGARTEIVRSLLESGCTIHDGYCADSIIGARTKVGAGLITANKRLDRKNIAVTVADKKVTTSTNALGVITGEDVKIGIKVGTMPGMLIGAESTIFPGEIIYTNVPANSSIKLTHTT